MKWFCLRGIALVCLIAASAWTAPRPDVGAIYERLICVVPMVGSGTVEDPIRPMFTPVPLSGPEEQGQAAGLAHEKSRRPEVRFRRTGPFPVDRLVGRYLEQLSILGARQWYPSEEQQHRRENEFAVSSLGNGQCCVCASGSSLASWRFSARPKVNVATESSVEPHVHAGRFCGAET